MDPPVLRIHIEIDWENRNPIYNRAAAAVTVAACDATEDATDRWSVVLAAMTNRERQLFYDHVAHPHRMQIYNAPDR